MDELFPDEVTILVSVGVVDEVTSPIAARHHLAQRMSFEVANRRFPAEFPSPKRQRGTKETFNFPSLTFRGMKKRNFKTRERRDHRNVQFSLTYVSG